MTPRRRRPVEVLVLARRALACPRVVEPEPVDVVVPAPAVLVRRLAWGGLTAVELRDAVRDVFREGARCR